MQPGTRGMLFRLHGTTCQIAVRRKCGRSWLHLPDPQIHPANIIQRSPPRPVPIKTSGLTKKSDKRGI